jgi:hypothetical protein
MERFLKTKATGVRKSVAAGVSTLTIVSEKAASGKDWRGKSADGCAGLPDCRI